MGGMDPARTVQSAGDARSLAAQLRDVNVSLHYKNAYVPAIRIEDLGDPSFNSTHGLTYPYVAGAMANGIGSVEIVEAMARAGMLGFFGAAGLPPARVEAAIDTLESRLGDDAPFGFNLIHSPSEPHLERAVVDLYLRRRVRLVSASAYLDLTPEVVRYRLNGLREAADGTVHAPNRVIAKVSRVEVASKFFAPAPDKIVRELLASGRITEAEARLSQRIPVAGDLTVEADSGGHTDNRPALTLIPTMVALKDRMAAAHAYSQPLRVGAAGGIATPQSAAAAFSMGAAYILAGSIHQACVEAGTSDIVRGMLADARQADVTMAPAADMFEMGVKVQVLKRGTLFPLRAAKLYDLYRAYGSLDEIPAGDRAKLEKDVFRAPLSEIWTQTKAFFAERDPSQVARADGDPKHKMALVFRWYLGQSSSWANRGVADRKLDYQIWCGPSMGAFNEWTAGTFLAEPANRRVAVVGINILKGAAILLRAQMLRAQGVHISSEELRITPERM